MTERFYFYTSNYAEDKEMVATFPPERPFLPNPILPALLGVCLVFLSQIATMSLPETGLGRPLTIASLGFSICIPALTLSYFTSGNNLKGFLTKFFQIMGVLFALIGIGACFFHLGSNIGFTFVVMILLCLTTLIYSWTKK
jgi:hypothetical protein